MFVALSELTGFSFGFAIGPLRLSGGILRQIVVLTIQSGGCVYALSTAKGRVQLGTWLEGSLAQLLLPWGGLQGAEMGTQFL